MSKQSSHIRLVTGPGREPKDAPGAGGDPRAAWSLLVRRAQAGDVPAFEQLVREHQGAVYAFAVAQVRSTADAAEVAQEALIKAFRKLKTYRFEAPFRTWLLQITRNTCTDRLRQRHATDEGARRYAQLLHPDPPQNPEEALGARRATARVHEALANVEPIYRETLILFDLQGLSHQEIAEICGIPLGTVKSRLARGRESLRRALIAQKTRDATAEAAKTGEEETP